MGSHLVRMFWSCVISAAHLCAHTCIFHLYYLTHVATTDGVRCAVGAVGADDVGTLAADARHIHLAAQSHVDKTSARSCRSTYHVYPRLHV